MLPSLVNKQHFTSKITKTILEGDNLFLLYLQAVSVAPKLLNNPFMQVQLFLARILWITNNDSTVDNSHVCDHLTHQWNMKKSDT